MSERTRTTRTYLTPQGSRLTMAYAGSVNYRDSSGHWQPIDDALVTSSQPGYAYTEKANAYRLELPAQLGTQPVRIAAGANSLSFALRGAQGPGKTNGPTATYRDALPATDVSYTASADGVKEALTLASLAAPKSFSYDLALGAGLHAKRLANGAIVLRRHDGSVAFGLQAPFMYDRAGATAPVAAQLQRNTGGYRLTLRPSRAWLSSSTRAWPVTIDPTTATYSPTHACYLESDTPTTSYCDGLTLKLGYDGANKYRPILQFDLSGLDHSTVVLNAELGLYVQGETTSNTATIGAYQVTTPWWDTSWNNADTGVAWTTPGGDFASGPAATSSAVGGSTGAFTLYPTQLVQQWVNDPSTNDGLLLKQTSENVNNVLTLGGTDPSVPSEQMPYLAVRSTYGQGAWDRYSMVGSQQLDDHLGLAVNATSGNLLVSANDFSVGGFSFGRYYNSYAELDPAGGGQLSWDWIMGTGVDVYLEFFHDGSVGYHGPSGFAVPFIHNSDGSFRPPNSLDAQLVNNGDGTYTLTMNSDASQQTFNSDGLLISESDLNGNKTTFNYSPTPPSAFGTGPWQLTSVVDPEGRTTSFTYDPNDGLLTQVSDPGGRLYKYAYDPTTLKLTSYTDPANGVTRYGYNSSTGALSQITDPKGNVTKITYDSIYQVASITRVTGGGTGPKTTFTYNDPNSGALPPYNTVVTDPNSHATTYYYDSQYRVTKVTDPKGNSTSVDFTDAHGGSNCADDNPCSVTDALGHTTKFGYSDVTNSNGFWLGQNQLWQQSPLEGTTNRPTFAYGDSTYHKYWPTLYTNERGKNWTSNYDENTNNHNGNLTSQVDGAQQGGQAPVRFTYTFNDGHLQGTMATAKDAKGNTTTYSYSWDANTPTRMTQMVVNPPAPLPSTTINYDSLGRVSSEVDGNANTRTYTYDALDRVKTITYSHSGQTSQTITYNYDADGNVSSMVDNTGTTTDTYDALNRLTKEMRPDTSSTQYAYDVASNLTALTDASGTTSYLYDAADLLTKITEPGGKIVTFGYDANGNRTTITYPGSVVGTFGYDASNRIQSISWVKGGTATLASFTYSYTDPQTGLDTDVRQSVVSFLSGDAQSTTTNYGYDYFARLTSASSSGGSTSSYSYGYDVNGNRTSQTVNGTSTYYLYNAANELCWSGSTDPGTTYSCSNLPSGGKTYSYDGNGNMLIGSSNSFAYNNKNQTSSITPNGGSAINMTYSGPGQSRRTAAGATGYVNDALGVASEGSTYYTRDSAGIVLGERNPNGGSGSYYFLFDGLGSVVAVCDATGAVKDTFKYSPFGESTAATAPVANPWRFAGGYLDNSTGLYKMGQRYYDQSLGRWTQIDAVNDPLDTHGWNRYVYAGDDPTSLVDPSGTCYNLTNSVSPGSMNTMVVGKRAHLCRVVAGLAGRCIDRHHISFWGGIGWCYRKAGQLICRGSARLCKNLWQTESIRGEGRPNLIQLACDASYFIGKSLIRAVFSNILSALACPEPAR